LERRLVVEPQIEYFDPKFERMPKEDLLDFQFQLFKKELQTAWEKNPFYRKKFTEAGIKPDDIRTRDDISKSPLTTKDDFLKDITEYPPYGSRLQVPTSQVTRVVMTSGTSGRGQEVHPIANEDTERVQKALAYGFFWAGVRQGTVVVQTWPVTLTGAPLWFHGAVAMLGGNMLQIGNYSTEEKLKLMKQFSAEAMFCDVAFLRRMEHVADEIGMDLKKEIGMKSILTMGMGVSPEWVAARQEKWGAKLYEQYASTQRVVTWTCEYGMVRGDGSKGFIHWLPHLCLVEVVDPATGRHVAPGEEGEIIITLLGSVASPIIRFQTKDIGKYLLSEGCPCGRPFDGFESASIHRLDNMIKIKGINIWPNTVDNCVFTVPNALEYKGEVFLDDRGREQVAVYVEFHSGLAETSKQQLIAQVDTNLKKNTGLNFLVREWPGPSILAQREKTAQRKVIRWQDRRYREAK
jgi:phenylacetate-CoA ligase